MDASAVVATLDYAIADAAENYLYLGTVAVPTWHMYNDSIVNYTFSVNGKYWMPWLSWMV